MKTLFKKQQQKNQQQTSKHKPVTPKGKASAATAVEPEEAPEQLSAYDSYYKHLSEELELVERHVRDLQQTLGLEHLSEAEAQAQVDFMLRFSAWVFNQHLQEQQIAITADKVEIVPESVKAVKVQKPRGQSNKKVTKSLSR